MNDVTVYSAVPFQKLHKFLEADENNMAICPSCEERKLKLRNFNYVRFHCEAGCDKELILWCMDPFQFLFEKFENCTFSEVIKKIKEKP